MSIAIRFEDGVIKEVTSDSPGVEGTEVAILHDTETERIVRVAPANLTLVMIAARARTQCEGIGIACEIAGERILEISKTLYSEPSRMIDDLNDIVRELVGIVGNAVDSTLDRGCS